MLLLEKLLYLRKKAGLSQEDVAEKLGVSWQTISKWETDQTVPKLIKAKLLSQFYKEISQLYDAFKDEFVFNDTNTVLILKDILYQKYKMLKKKNK